MQCPACSGELVELERSGVRIDACRQCRGVWLDRGELDKILARADRELGDDPGYRFDRDPGHRDDDDDDDRGRYRERDEWMATPGRHRKKRKNFLSEMFEFGDD